ncbi:MAG TPA: LysR substrate-binding domain-containing protein [Rhizobiaceae bacterium]|nr:LysR substrate-binding domain-containing protein [Rhizobiaceae bacterium]
MNDAVGTRDLRTFAAVAEELHFRRAAEKLRMAQPHLSAQIRQLEERLDVKLFDRTTRSVKLTAAGAHFLERARYVLAQVDEAVASTRLVAAGRSGHLRIGFTPAASFEVLPWLLRTFHESRPDVFVAPVYGETGSQISDLLVGQLDFGLLRLPVHTRRLSTLALSSERVVAAIPRRHNLAGRVPMMLEDLAGEDFIQYAPLPGVEFQEHVQGYLHRAGFKPRVVFEAQDTYSMLAMVAAGLGIAILPEWVSRLMQPEIVFSPLAQIPAVVDLALAWVAEAPSSHMQAFIDIAASFSKKTG